MLINDTDNMFKNACAYAETVISWQYRTVLTAEIILAFSAIPPNLILLFTVWRVQVFSSNLRLLLAHIDFNLIWLAVGDIIKAGYTLAAPICSNQFTLRGCRFFEIFTTVAVLQNVFYSLTALCIQRLYTSLTFKTYEKAVEGRKPWLAIALIASCWISAFLVAGHDFWMLPENIYVPICDPNIVSFYHSEEIFNQHIQYAYVALECAAALITLFIYFRNRYVASHMVINRALYDLSARFQIDMNVRVNALLLPSMILHFLCHTPNYFFLTSIRMVTTIPAETKVWITRLTIVWRMVYALIHPFLAFHFNDHIRHHLTCSCLARLWKKTSSEVNEAGCLVAGGGGGAAGAGDGRVRHHYHHNMLPVPDRPQNASSNVATHFDLLDKIWTQTKPRGSGGGGMHSKTPV